MNVNLNEILSIRKLASLPLFIRLLIALGVMIVTAIVVAVVSVVFITRSTDELARYKQEEETKMAQLAKAQKAQIEAEVYQEAIHSAQDTLEEISKKLPSGIDAASFLKQLSSNARQNGIKVIRSKAYPTENKGFIEEIPIEIAGCATYHQLGSFVANLSELERIITLEKFAMSSHEIYSNRELGGMVSVKPAMRDASNIGEECASNKSLPFIAKISTYRYKDEN